MLLFIICTVRRSNNNHSHNHIIIMPCGWDGLVEEALLQTGLVTGVAIISHHQRECVYSYGSLQENTFQENWDQFSHIFQQATENHNEKVCNAGFTLHLGENIPKHFKVIRKTLCSLYGTSEGGTGGLIICSLPYGILICVHNQPSCAGRVITVVEQFADMLRA